MEIRLLKAKEKPPMDLLLLADPSKSIVEKNLKSGHCYMAEQDNQVIGVYVLVEIKPRAIELVNIAIDEKYQGKGLGKILVMDAIRKAKEQGYEMIEVGTGNSSIGQLALYQKCGFRLTDIEMDFFINNYEEEILENGIQCRDMIRLSQEL